MEHIQDIYKEKPELIENLLKNHVSKINLKVDGKPFQVLYNEETDELEFHGRSGNETTVGPLITDIDRYFSKFVNDAIRHIEDRADLFKKYKFMTIEIIDNELLLTSIITKSGEFVNSPKEIRKIADELETEVMPTLWEGQLSDAQIKVLMEIIKSGEVPTKGDFIKVVKALFDKDPNFPKKLIMANTEFIEGIVFFFDVKGKIVEYKLVDPAFRAQSAGYKASSKEEKDKNKETYNKLYEFYLDWVEKNGEKLADNRIHSIELNYIKMMKDPKIYNKVMNMASGIRINNIARYGVQLDRTTPEMAKEIRKNGDVYKTLYEIFFNMFKKPKKRNYTINKEFQMKVNDAIALFEGMEGYEHYVNDLIEEGFNWENIYLNEYDELMVLEDKEDEENKNKFDIAFDNKDEELDYFMKHCFKGGVDKEVISSFFDHVFSYDLSSKPFRFSSNAAKLARIYAKSEDFIQSLTGKENIEVDSAGIKIGDTIIKFGNGSVDRISTADQESGTCSVWNTFVRGENMPSSDQDLPKYIADIASSVTYMKNGKETKFPLDWQKSFVKQILGILDLCKELKIESKNYSLSRRNSDDISKAYYKFNKEYTKSISGGEGSIDNYDPSDVILYQTDEATKIISTLEQMTGKCPKDSETDEDLKKLIRLKKDYLEVLFNKNLCIGISLKKIMGAKSHEYSKMNVNDDDVKTKVTDFKNITGEKSNGVTLECTGDFVLKHISDPMPNKDENGELSKENRMFLEMRSFNQKGDENQMAIDVKLNKKDPSLGKVAKREWVKILFKEIGKDKKLQFKKGYNERSSFNQKETVKAFKEFFLEDGNKKLQCEALTKFIESAMKVGGLCFPYVIIH